MGRCGVGKIVGQLREKQPSEGEFTEENRG